MGKFNGFFRVHCVCCTKAVAASVLKVEADQWLNWSKIAEAYYYDGLEVAVDLRLLWT